MKNRKNFATIFCLLLILIVGVSLLILNKPKPQVQKLVEYFMVYTPSEDSPNEVPAGAVPILGCGTEYAVKVASNAATMGGLQESLNELFNINNADYDGSDYINSLALSDAVVTIVETENLIDVNMNGKILSAGTCDDPRIQAQIEETVKYYAVDKPYTIRLNGSESDWNCWGDMSGECQ